MSVYKRGAPIAILMTQESMKKYNKHVQILKLYLTK